MAIAYVRSLGSAGLYHRDQDFCFGEFLNDHSPVQLLLGILQLGVQVSTPFDSSVMVCFKPWTCI